jgi:hypothetical protein
MFKKKLEQRKVWRRFLVLNPLYQEQGKTAFVSNLGRWG